MSYEGVIQVLCEEGHLSTYDCYSPSKKCHYCQAKIVWEHSVDETNGSKRSDYAQSFLVEKPKTNCECCGQQIGPNVYEIPTLEK